MEQVACVGIPSAEGAIRRYRLNPVAISAEERSILGNFGVLFHSEGFETENIDVEMGFLLEQDFMDTIRLSDDQIMTARTIPAVATMATLARVGIYNDSIQSFGLCHPIKIEMNESNWGVQ